MFLSACTQLPGTIQGQIIPWPGEVVRPDRGQLVVVAEPLGGTQRGNRLGEALTVRCHTGSFTPPFLVVAVGQRVRFLNEDRIHHRIFSSSGPVPFDLGVLSCGKSRTIHFEQPGTRRIYCSLHEDERGFILVVPTPYFDTVDPSGKFEISGLAPGRYELQTWSEHLPVRRLGITVMPAKVTAVQIPITDQQPVK